ncbi:UNVERIFIED_CONTAM: hypothetical protein RMT77_009869 [Armadillidium vulgare]
MEGKRILTLFFIFGTLMIYESTGHLTENSLNVNPQKDDKKLFYVYTSTITKTTVRFITSVVPTYCSTSVPPRRQRGLENAREARQACSRRRLRELPNLDDISLNNAPNLDASVANYESKINVSKEGKSFMTMVHTVRHTITVTTLSTNTAIKIGVSLICSDSAITLAAC